LSKRQNKAIIFIQKIDKNLDWSIKMPKPYSIDLREKIVAAYNNGEGSMRKLAKRGSCKTL